MRKTCDTCFYLYNGSCEHAPDCIDAIHWRFNLEDEQEDICKLCEEEILHSPHSSPNFLCEGSYCEQATELYTWMKALRNNPKIKKPMSFKEHHQISLEKHAIHTGGTRENDYLIIDNVY